MPLTKFKRGNYWWIRGTVASRKVYESTRIALAFEEQAEAVRIQTEKDLTDRAVFGDAVVADFSEAVIDYIEMGGESRFLDRILPHLGTTPLKDINQALLNRLAKKIYPNAAPATINRQFFTPVSAVLNLAAENGKWNARRIRRLKVAKTIPTWVAPFEADRLIHAANPAFGFALELLFGSGGRSGETLRLDFSDVSLDSGHCIFRSSKGDRTRSVILPPRTLKAICQLPHRTGAVVRSSSGKPYSAPRDKSAGGMIAGQFKTAIRTAELDPKLTPHSTRHSWATWHWAATKDLFHLKQRGGWADADTVEIYAHIAKPETAGQAVAAGWCAKSVHPITEEARRDAKKYNRNNIINLRKKA